MTDLTQAFEKWWDKTCTRERPPSYLDVYKAGRESMRKEAIDAVTNEFLIEKTGDPADEGYQAAISHSLEAIKEIP
jgi:hypothetical protein